MVEIIDGEAVELEDESVKALVAANPAAVGYVQSGIGAIAALSDEEFEANIVKLKKAVTRARRMQEALLEDGTDYGSVKGVKRPFLHKPGAEKFEKAYGLATSYTVERHVGDGESAPDLEFVVHARVHLGSTDGPVVAEGLGAANSWETKYRYRTGTARLCPDCGKQTVIKLPAKGDREATFWCGTRDGGCGHRFPLDDARMNAESEKVENADPWDLANTLLKMARKRAHVDGILTATGTSGLFTQDEDAPITPSAEAVAHRATGPAQDNPVKKIDSPGRWQGEVTKVDPEGGVRQAKIEWLDKGKKAHEKVELKVKVTGTGTLTVIAVDQVALALANGEFRNGDVVSFDGEVVERVWQEGKPPIKEIRNPPGIWRFRGGAWTPLGPVPAPPADLEEPDYLRDEQEILELVEPMTWQELTAGLKPMLVRQGEDYARTGYIVEPIEVKQMGEAWVVNASLGVPHEGIFKIATREGDVVGITKENAPLFDVGAKVEIRAVGNVTTRGTHMLVLTAVGAAK